MAVWAFLPSLLFILPVGCFTAEGVLPTVLVLYGLFVSRITAYNMHTYALSPAFVLCRQVVIVIDWTRLNFKRLLILGGNLKEMPTCGISEQKNWLTSHILSLSLPPTFPLLSVLSLSPTLCICLLFLPFALF